MGGCDTTTELQEKGKDRLPCMSVVSHPPCVRYDSKALSVQKKFTQHHMWTLKPRFTVDSTLDLTSLPQV